MNATTADKVFTKCNRCAGRGHFTCYQNIAGGVCFACGGSKGIWETRETLARRARAAKDERAKAHADMERRLDEMAPLHAIWEQRGDLIADRFPEIHPEAMVAIAAREELWEEDALWMQSVDNNRRNSMATGY